MIASSTAAFIFARCDACGHVEELYMGLIDERPPLSEYRPYLTRRLGWTVQGNATRCRTCSEQGKESTMTDRPLSAFVADLEGLAFPLPRLRDSRALLIEQLADYDRAIAEGEAAERKLAFLQTAWHNAETTQVSRVLPEPTAPVQTPEQLAEFQEAERAAAAVVFAGDRRGGDFVEAESAPGPEAEQSDVPLADPDDDEESRVERVDSPADTVETPATEADSDDEPEEEVNTWRPARDVVLEWTQSQTEPFGVNQCASATTLAVTTVRDLLPRLVKSGELARVRDGGPGIPALYLPASAVVRVPPAPPATEPAPEPKAEVKAATPAQLPPGVKPALPSEREKVLVSLQGMASLNMGAVSAKLLGGRTGLGAPRVAEVLAQMLADGQVRQDGDRWTAA